MRLKFNFFYGDDVLVTAPSLFGRWRRKARSLVICYATIVATVMRPGEVRRGSIRYGGAKGIQRNPRQIRGLVTDAGALARNQGLSPWAWLLEDSAWILFSISQNLSHPESFYQLAANSICPATSKRSQQARSKDLLLLYATPIINRCALICEVYLDEKLPEPTG